MTYDVTILKEILLKLKELNDGETISLKDFSPEQHEDISLNVLQLIKNNIIVGSYFGNEKSENDFGDFSIRTIKNIEIANKLLLYLKKEREVQVPQLPLSKLIAVLKKQPI